MKRRRALGEGIHLDSLADIVSNMLGVFVILLACFALLAVARASTPIKPSGVSAPPKLLTLKVPWPKASTKNSVFAAMTGGRIQVLDADPVYRQLMKHPFPRRPQPIDVEQADVSIRFYPLTNEAYCLQFRPHEAAGEPLRFAGEPGSAWLRARERFPKDRFAFFFWVSADSFESFRTLRETLLREGVDVEWKPVQADTPLEICQGVDGNRGMEPQ